MPLEYARAIDELERAYTACRAAGDRADAVRTARTLRCIGRVDGRRLGRGERLDRSVHAIFTKVRQPVG